MKFLKQLIVLSIAALFSTCGDKIKKDTIHNEVAQTAKKPNIVLIITDDQGWGDLSINGNTNLNTPNIDALAKNGVRFDNFYVQPVCSPTRAEILTGRHAARLGVYDTSAGGERMNLGETTFAEIFKKNGYRTAAYGKWHNGMQAPYHPNARGFDDFYGFASGHWGSYFSPILEHNGILVRGEGFLPDDLTNKGIEFIEEHKDEPFLLYLPYNTPHSPMQVPDEYWDKFQNKEISRKYSGKEEEQLEFTKAALAMVENIDANVGRLMKKINALQLEENTIVIFMSDNGPNSSRWNAGMRGKKGSTDEGGVRSPFFIQWKSVLPEGKTITEIASGIDILPTLANLANLKIETQNPIDGKSLKPLLTEAKSTWEPRFIFNHWNGKTSVRFNKYRLDDENRVYDITTDRGQKTDIAHKLSSITNTLQNAKSNWLKKVLPLTKIEDGRPFTLGHPDFKYTQIPARDGIPHGNIKRSNRWPNDSFFMNWTRVTDSITWDIDVLENGTYEVSLLYTLAEGDVGVAIQLSHGNSRFLTRLGEAHDPPLKGMENDRVKRNESYIKDFKPKALGSMKLSKGRQPLVLKAIRIPGKAAMDVRLLFFKRVG